MEYGYSKPIDNEEEEKKCDAILVTLGITDEARAEYSAIADKLVESVETFRKESDALVAKYPSLKVACNFFLGAGVINPDNSNNIGTGVSQLRWNTPQGEFLFNASIDRQQVMESGIKMGAEATLREMMAKMTPVVSGEGIVSNTPYETTDPVQELPQLQPVG